MLNMPVDIAEDWVAALRSGEYKQGRARLQNVDNEFCCLGVLVDRLIKTGRLPGRWSADNHGRPVVAVSPPGDFAYRISTALDGVAQDYGFDPSGKDDVAGSQGFFMCLNDTEKKTFAEIADVIEQINEPPQ